MSPQIICILQVPEYFLYDPFSEELLGYRLRGQAGTTNTTSRCMMVIEFSVENYRSFKQRVTLSMVAANIKAQDSSPGKGNIFHFDDDLTLLKTVALYGANASGKSNLIAAMRFMKYFVLNSSRQTQINDEIDIEPFRLSTTTENQPSHFEMVFLLAGKIYRYGFEVTRQRVVAEWLYYVPNTRESRLFERETDTFSLSRTFKEGRDIEDKTRENALFLSVVAQFNGTIARNILQWFQELDVGLEADDVVDLLKATARFEGSLLKDEIIRFMRKLDTGIADVQVEKGPLNFNEMPISTNVPDNLQPLLHTLQNVIGEDAQRPLLKTLHQKYDEHGHPSSLEVFEFEGHESRGTQKLFILTVSLLHTLQKGGVLIIDEFDTRIHPLLTREVIKLFHAPETNPHNAQLIFATHDINLLTPELFRRDQIWFIEKDERGASHLYSLVEYKGVRNDASFEREYIQGKYGAIPFVGNLRNLAGVLDE